MTKRILLAAALALGFAVATPASAAGPSTVVVTPGDMAASFADVLIAPESWFFFNDENNTIDASLGSFVAGPGTPPAGTDSVQISVTGTERRNLATYRFAGTSLADITDLRFSTYNPSAGNGGAATRSAYLNFNVDFDGSDTWQRRLVFVPSQNGAVVQDQWQQWDAIAGGAALWRYSGPTWPVTGQPGTTAKTWAQILSDYPGVRIRVTDSWLGLRVGEPYASGYTENLDAFVFGTAAGVTTFDFEITAPVLVPTSMDDCKNGGWATFTSPSFKNQGLCIKFVQTGK